MAATAAVFVAVSAAATAAVSVSVSVSVSVTVTVTMPVTVTQQQYDDAEPDRTTALSNNTTMQNLIGLRRCGGGQRHCVALVNCNFPAIHATSDEGRRRARRTVKILSGRGRSKSGLNVSVGRRGSEFQRYTGI